MNGVNKAIIIGTLGQDPEATYSQDGNCICRLSVATNEKWKDKDGKQEQSTEWHRVVLFSKLAEIALQYLSKGSKIYLEGKIKTRKWKDKSGENRWTTEIVGLSMQMLGDKDKQQNHQVQQSNQNSSTQSNIKDDFDPEIPF